MPPEAYTHKELAEAMKWRESQPEYIKAMTTTPDSLMSFYKRAMRSQSNGFDGKMSESFKSDLKSIAEGLKTFDSSAAPQPPAAQSFETPKATTAQQTQSPQQPTPKSEPSSPVSKIEFELPDTSFHPPETSKPLKSPKNPISVPSSSEPANKGFDEKSQKMIREVKEQLNLGSDEATLRLLIKLGYEKSRKLFSE